MEIHSNHFFLIFLFPFLRRREIYSFISHRQHVNHDNHRRDRYSGWGASIWENERPPGGREAGVIRPATYSKHRHLLPNVDKWRRECSLSLFDFSLQSPQTRVEKRQWPSLTAAWGKTKERRRKNKKGGSQLTSIHLLQTERSKRIDLGRRSDSDVI